MTTDVSATLPTLDRVHALASEAEAVRQQIQREHAALNKLQHQHFQTHFGTEPRLTRETIEAADHLATLKVVPDSCMKFRMHCVVKLQQHGSDPVAVSCYNNIISMPLNIAPTDFASDILQNVASIDKIWMPPGHKDDPKSPSHALQALPKSPSHSLQALRDMLCAVLALPDFKRNWTSPDQSSLGSDLQTQRERVLLHRSFALPRPDATKVVPTTLSMFYSDFVQPVSSTLNSHKMDINDHLLRRSFRECVEAMRHFNVKPRELMLYARDPSGQLSWGVQINVTPTTQQHARALDIGRFAVNAADEHLGDTKRKTGTMFAVSCLGIVSDHSTHNNEPQLSESKRFLLQEVLCTPHNRFGWHEAHFGHFAAPKLQAYARWLGEVHFMTQVAKALLKSRDEIVPRSDVAEAVAEQRGAQLRNEARLCAYWNKVQSLLTPEEDKCLRTFITQLKGRPMMLSVRLNNARALQACDPVCESDTERLKVRTLNRMFASFNIKGAYTLPLEGLQRSAKFVDVRINNTFPLEMSTMAYDSEAN